MKVKKAFQGVIKDIGEVILSLLLIIIISRLLFGAQMLVPLVAVTSCSMLHGADTLGMISASFAPLLGESCFSSSNNWKDWIRKNSLSQEVDTFPFQSGFSIGDMILVVTPNGRGEQLGFSFPTLFSATKLGDVVIYNRDKEHGQGEPIIHRVVGIVKVRNWSVAETEGTLACLTEEDFEKKYIPFIVKCINGKECAYWQFPQESDFNFYLTKGDNNGGVDQCGPSPISHPVNEEQLSARAWIRIPYLGWLKLILNFFLGLFLG